MAVLSKAQRKAAANRAYQMSEDLVELVAEYKQKKDRLAVFRGSIMDELEKLADSGVVKARTAEILGSIPEEQREVAKNKNWGMIEVLANALADTEFLGVRAKDMLKDLGVWKGKGGHVDENLVADWIEGCEQFEIKNH